MSYSTGSVAGVSQVGGLVGANAGGSWMSDAMVQGSYSSGRITGNTDVGGLIGHNEYHVTMSYWDVESSGEPNMCGSQGEWATGCDPNYGKTTAEMKQQATFEGWDFVGEIENSPNDVWKIVEGKTYPLLSWQKYGGGTGEPNDPYLIYTAEHLNELLPR